MDSPATGAALAGGLLSNGPAPEGGAEPPTPPGLGLGRCGDVSVLHMVAPKKDHKLHMIDGEALGGQRVVATLLDSNQPLLAQWAALPAPPHLTVFKLHEAMAKPAHHGEFTAELERLYSDHGDALGAAAVVPMESDRRLADRFSMMSLLDEVSSLVSAALSRQSGDLEAPRCCVPAFQDIDAASFEGTLPAALAYPVVVKPRDSSDHSHMGLVFDDEGLRSFTGTLGTDFRAEQFISHGGRVYKVFVLDEQVYVGERKSLPDVESTDPEALSQLAAKVDGEHVRDSDSGVGYLLFDSAVLTKGKEKLGKGLAPARRLGEQGLDVLLVSLLKDSIAKRIGTRLFGFDLLVGASTGQYFVVDVNVFPGYKGVDEAYPHLRQHLVQRAAQDAVREDVRRLSSEDNIRQICMGTVPAWEEGDQLTVARLRSPSNHVFLVTNATPGEPGKRPSVICRLFGREDFGPKGTFENSLIAHLSARKLCAGLISCIAARYFGEQMHLGRVEETLLGRNMDELLQDASTDLAAICGHVGNAFTGLHALLGEDMRGTSPRAGGSSVTELFRTRSSRPKVLSRGNRWRINAMIAVNGSQLQAVPIWQELHSGFHRVAAEMEALMESAGTNLSSSFSSRMVFGHFDPTPANLVVVGPPAAPEAAHLVDFEWAGPNLAVYDFAKFYISMQMRIDQGRCQFTEAQLQAGLRAMVGNYLRQLLGSDGEEGPEGPEGDGEGELELQTTRFCTDVLQYAPVVAAVNLCSNLIHASEENQLLEVPATADRWLPDGSFNWLAHAATHMSLYFKAARATG